MDTLVTGLLATYHTNNKISGYNCCNGLIRRWSTSQHIQGHVVALRNWTGDCQCTLYPVECVSRLKVLLYEVRRSGARNLARPFVGTTFSSERWLRVYGEASMSIRNRVERSL